MSERLEKTTNNQGYAVSTYEERMSNQNNPSCPGSCTHTSELEEALRHCDAALRGEGCTDIEEMRGVAGLLGRTSRSARVVRRYRFFDLLSRVCDGSTHHAPQACDEHARTHERARARRSRFLVYLRIVV